ncbi:MAG: hypothetical protein Q8O93_00355 [bacterium]|nr:hypothetical protein [bacterium]
MLAYLKKFNNLPAAARAKVSNKQAIAAVEALEREYNIALAALIMKVMVGEVKRGELKDYLLKENLSPDKAGRLAGELEEKFFPPEPVNEPAETARPAMDAAPAGEAKVKGASFFFSADDEAEIRELAQKIEMPAAAAWLDDMLKLIIDRAQINFGSADLAARFSQIIKTYLRGIRNRLETKNTLTKPFLNGGLSFDDDSADKVMALAEKVINSKKDEPIKPLPKINLAELEKESLAEKREIPRDAAYDFSRLRDQAKKIKNDLKKLDTGHELAPLPPAAKKDQPVKPPAPKPKRVGETGPPKAEAGNMPLIKRRFEAENLNQSPKVKVEDVKYVPRVMSPLDELKYMDLANFRRLDSEPLRVADKISGKLSLLEEEDYGKKLEGIKAWRTSPIYGLYLEIGHLSISENKPVDVIIEEKKMRGEDFLTSKEFEAIMDLNKSLRF